MHRRTDKISRRWFSLGVLAAPLTALLGVDALAPKAKADEPARSSNQAAGAPFGLTETFHRNLLAMPIAPFAMREVELHDGPLKQSLQWNRNYMMRLSVDRLLYNFRVTAGLPSSAQPLGGWESPETRTPRAFRRTLPVGLRFDVCLDRRSSD